jgi:DMSO/TMAO reductase YedYZ molybdopterin-dependent catalytic subunit
MECAGNGRARLQPRPVSQPWLVEAVGTADWTGVPLRDLVQDSGVDTGAIQIVFSGTDHGVERGVEQDYQRALPLA